MQKKTVHAKFKNWEDGGRIEIEISLLSFPSAAISFLPILRTTQYRVSRKKTLRFRGLNKVNSVSLKTLEKTTSFLFFKKKLIYIWKPCQSTIAVYRIWRGGKRLGSRSGVNDRCLPAGLGRARSKHQSVTGRVRKENSISQKKSVP